MTAPRFFLPAFMLLFTVSVWAEKPAEKAKVTVEKNVMVAMRDGVKLATDIYLPVGNTEKLPVILTRLPYNKDGAKSFGEYFAAHGYAFVAQDTRGRYASEGTWHFMTDDGREAQTAPPGSANSHGQTARSAWWAPPMSAEPSTRWPWKRCLNW